MSQAQLHLASGPPAPVSVPSRLRSYGIVHAGREWVVYAVDGIVSWLLCRCPDTASGEERAKAFLARCRAGRGA